MLNVLNSVQLARAPCVSLSDINLAIGAKAVHVQSCAYILIDQLSLDLQQQIIHHIKAAK